MDNENQKRKEETKVLDQEAIIVIIPQCCREGWDSCKHSVRPLKKRKNNIGL